MSLINDALKRASTQAQNMPAPAPTPEAMPVHSAPLRDKSLMPMVLGAVLVLCLIAAAALFWKWANASQKTAPATPLATSPTPLANPATASIAPGLQPTPVPVAAFQPSPAPVAKLESATPVATPAEAPAPAVVAPSAPVAVPTVPPAETPDSAVVAAPVPPPVEVKPAVPTFPDLKLQGIFYNPANPSAVINRKTFSVGAIISGARITKIEQEAVTVEWNGETRVLELTQ